MKSFVRIIHNNKVLMNDQEFEDYKNICRSYDRTNFKGEDLFKGLLHTDDNGWITHIGIPSSQQTSFEIFFFVCALYEQQKMRMFEDRMDQIVGKLEKKLMDIGVRWPAENCRDLSKNQ